MLPKKLYFVLFYSCDEKLLKTGNKCLFIGVVFLMPRIGSKLGDKGLINVQ